MPETDFLQSYPNHLEYRRAAVSQEGTFEADVSGEFLAMGKIERALLVSLGLRSQHFVVDVGCGSGRLALPLASIRGLRYLGTDVVPDVLDRAQALARREDWCFACTDGRSIPCADRVADFVCFFSVFTHLPHDAAFHYLREATRVLRPGGYVVFSFLEFYIDCHWPVFADYVDRTPADCRLNQFIDRQAILAWARHAGLRVEAIHDGDKPHIPLEDEMTWQDGRHLGSHGCLGQSVAVLSKPL